MVFMESALWQLVEQFGRGPNKAIASLGAGEQGITGFIPTVLNRFLGDQVTLQEAVGQRDDERVAPPLCDFQAELDEYFPRPSHKRPRTERKDLNFGR